MNIGDFQEHRDFRPDFRDFRSDFRTLISSSSKTSPKSLILSRRHFISALYVNVDVFSLVKYNAFMT